MSVPVATPVVPWSSTLVLTPVIDWYLPKPGLEYTLSSPWDQHEISVCLTLYLWHWADGLHVADTQEKSIKWKNRMVNSLWTCKFTLGHVLAIGVTWVAIEVLLYIYIFFGYFLDFPRLFVTGIWLVFWVKMNLMDILYTVFPLEPKSYGTYYGQQDIISFLKLGQNAVSCWTLC